MEKKMIHWRKICSMIIVLSAIINIGCNSRKDHEENNLIQIVDEKNETFNNCDTVKGRGIAFKLPNSSHIDSVICIRNDSIRVWCDLRKKNKDMELVIFDRIIFQNSYNLSLYYPEMKRTILIQKVLFKPMEVYTGFTCSLRSCEFNNKIIEAIAGRFELPENW